MIKDHCFSSGASRDSWTVDVWRPQTLPYQLEQRTGPGEDRRSSIDGVARPCAVCRESLWRAHIVGSHGAVEHHGGERCGRAR